MRTVIDVLRDNAVLEDRAHTFVRTDHSEVVLSFPELWRTACQRANRLHELGLEKGDRVAIILPETDTFVLGFLGCLTAGLVPVPVSPPLTPAKMDAYGETVRHILRASGAKALITMPRLQGLLGELLSGAGPGGEDVRVILDGALEGALEDDPEPPCTVAPGDLAFLQFTSGSTPEPKGVMVTHENLSVNAEAIMFDGLRSTPRDRGVSWLPPFHDMGLVGFVISPLYAKVPVMFLPTMSFIRRPRIWLDAIHRFRGTITFAPSFAYSLAARWVTDEQMQGWDLSCLKVLGCGAEPSPRDVLQGFADRFAPVGLSAKALLPCYGLAEATLAVTFVGLDEEMKIDRVCADSMKRGEARAPNGRGTIELVSSGRPFPGHRLRIVDEAGSPVAERVVGQILLRGPSVTAGYWGHPEETAEVFRDGWLHTGDLGYLADGELYVCGRKSPRGVGLASRVSAAPPRVALVR
jgi:fatty-acyl-CoA synthase